MDDAKRPLTPEGKQKMREIAAGLVRAGMEVDWIVSSPLVRAVETAEIVGEALGVQASPGLLRGSASRRRPGGIDRLSSPNAPTAGAFWWWATSRIWVELAARLIGAGRNANMPFKKGGCCLITLRVPSEIAGPPGVVAPPRVMRKLA